jgi:hypothetical protein
MHITTLLTELTTPGNQHKHISFRRLSVPSLLRRLHLLSDFSNGRLYGILAIRWQKNLPLLQQYNDVKNDHPRRFNQLMLDHHFIAHFPQGPAHCPQAKQAHFRMLTRPSPQTAG